MSEVLGGSPELTIEKPKDERTIRVMGGNVLGAVRKAELLPVMQNQRAVPTPVEDAPKPDTFPGRSEEFLTPPSQ